jgi:hypothetical protein
MSAFNRLVLAGLTYLIAAPASERCARMSRQLPACRRQGLYRDQSQKPLMDEEPSRAYARPTALPASFTTAARALQS